MSDKQINSENLKKKNVNVLKLVLNLLTKLMKTTYYLILPQIEKYPFISFIISLAVAFFHSKFIVYLVEDVSHTTGISASFFGITLISWAGNIGDTINASMATKAKKVDLLTTGILASQIMNLQICLGVPWIIAMVKNKIENDGDFLIDFGKENIIKLFLPLLFVVFMAVLIMCLFSRVLNKKSGFCLLIIYILYFAYESFNSKNSDSI